MLEYLVLFFIIPFASAQEIPDYNNPYAPIFFDKPIYTWTDKVRITIVAPSWNTDSDLIDSIGGDNDNPIKVSTRSHSLEPYRLTETDTSSGIFTGEVILTGFLHDADGDGDFDTNPRTFGNGPTSGFLQTQRDSAVTVSFEFADGVILTESVPISWNIGSIHFAKEFFLLGDSALVEVIDPDMNLNPEAVDQIIVDISSDTDSAGITTPLIETGESSGRFAASVSFSPNQPSSGNRLHAVPGDSIYAKYDDYTLPRPFSESDSQEISAVAKLESSTPLLERLIIEQVSITDSSGNKLQSFSSKNKIQIVGSILNNQQFKQDFVYLFQVKDQNQSVVSISWIVGQIFPNQSLDVSQSWTPPKSGQYTIETYAWKSINEPEPLAPSLSESIFVE